MTDQPDLFPVEETLSPFAKWKREHGVVIGSPDDESADWIAMSQSPDGALWYGNGDCEEEACLEMLSNRGLPHWLEPLAKEGM